MSCCFYLHVPDSHAHPELIALHEGDWSYLGSALRLLMAQSDVVPSLRPSPRGVNDPVAPNGLRVPVDAAIERLAHLVGIIQTHPLLPQIPVLPIYLQALLSHLRERAAHHQQGHAGDVWLVGQYEGDDELEGFRHDLPLRQGLHDDLWADVQRVGTAGDHHEIDITLFFDTRYLSFTDRQAWTESSCFGLSDFRHPYFARLDHDHHWLTPDQTPRDDAITYENFDPASEAESARERTLDERWTFSPFQPEQEGELWGLRCQQRDSSGAKAPWVLAPQWEALRRDVACEFAQPDGAPALPGVDRAWAKQSGLWALIRLGQPCQVLMPPSFDEVRDVILESPASRSVEESDAGARVVRQGDRYGVISLIDGRWLAPPQYDEVWPMHGQMRRVRQGGRQGFIDHDGACAMPLHYSDARDFDSLAMGSPSSLAWVAQDGLWGLVDRQGVLIQPCQFEEFERPEHDDGELGWRVVRQGRSGWMNADGTWAVPCEWDTVVPYHGVDSPPGLFHVQRQGRHGLLFPGRAPLIACEYLDIKPLGLTLEALKGTDPHEWDGAFHRSAWPDEPVSSFLAAKDPEKSWLMFAVKAESGWGVIDQANRCLVPLRYATVEPVAQNWFDQDPRWLRLIASDGRQGLWDLAGPTELVDCRFHHLTVISSAAKLPPVIFTVRRVAPHDDDAMSFRCELRLADGTPAFEGEYISLDVSQGGHAWPAAEGHGKMHCDRLAKAWASGTAVRVLQHGPDGHAKRVWLRWGHPPIEDEVWLQREFQRGDLDAALTLAKTHLDGLAQPPDEEKARRWAARACGQEDRPAQAGEAPAEAMLMFVRLLCQGGGGPTDFPLARQWAQQAVDNALRMSDAEEREAARVLLGMLLLDPRAGPVDAPGALALFEEIDARGPSLGEASFHWGLCLRDGVGTPRDVDHALEKFELANANHCPHAAAALIDLLQTLADEAPSPEATDELIARALHFAKKQALAMEYESYEKEVRSHEASFYVPLSVAEARQSEPERPHAQLGALLVQDPDGTDWELAQFHLQRAAEAGHVESMGLLWKGVYKIAHSPLRDKALARHWRARYCEAVCAGKPVLFRILFGLIARVMP